MAILRSLTAAGVGALAAYLFDPVSGTGRRARLKDQVQAAARQGYETVERRARYERGRLQGALHELGHSGEDRPRDDAELLQKVKSEALGPAGVVDAVTVEVAEGNVVLRGHLADESIRRDVVSRVEAVTGVRSVHLETSGSNQDAG